MTGDCTINLLLAAYLKILDKAEANLALARIVNYDCKLGSKLKRTFTIVNYGRETFIDRPQMKFGISMAILRVKEVNLEQMSRGKMPFDPK